jgi:hypothetical protein
MLNVLAPLGRLQRTFSFLLPLSEIVLYSMHLASACFDPRSSSYSGDVSSLKYK